MKNLPISIATLMLCIFVESKSSLLKNEQSKNLHYLTHALEQISMHSIKPKSTTLKKEEPPEKKPESGIKLFTKTIAEETPSQFKETVKKSSFQKTSSKDLAKFLLTTETNKNITDNVKILITEKPALEKTLFHDLIDILESEEPTLTENDKNKALAIVSTIDNIDYNASKNGQTASQRLSILEKKSNFFSSLRKKIPPKSITFDLTKKAKSLDQEAFLEEQKKFAERYLSGPRVGGTSLNFWQNNISQKLPTIFNQTIIWPLNPQDRDYIKNLINSNKTVYPSRPETTDALFHLAARINPALINPTFIKTIVVPYMNNKNIDNLFSEEISIFSLSTAFGNKNDAYSAIKRGWGLVLDTADIAIGLIKYYIFDLLTNITAFKKRGLEGPYKDIQNAIDFFIQAQIWIATFELEGDTVDTRFRELLQKKLSLFTTLLNEKQNTEALKTAGFSVDKLIDQASTTEHEEMFRHWCRGGYLMTGDNKQQRLEIPLGEKAILAVSKDDLDSSCSLKDRPSSAYFATPLSDLVIISCLCNQYEQLNKLITSNEKKAQQEQEKLLTVITILKAINKLVGYLLDNIDEKNRPNLFSWLTHRGFKIVDGKVMDTPLPPVEGLPFGPIIVNEIKARVCPLCFELPEEAIAYLSATAIFITKLYDEYPYLKSYIKKADIGIELLTVCWVLDGAIDRTPITKLELPSFDISKAKKRAENKLLALKQFDIKALIKEFEEFQTDKKFDRDANSQGALKLDMRIAPGLFLRLKLRSKWESA